MSVTPTRAHPRSRGENLAFVVPIVLAGGSSPLTRGKPWSGCHPSGKRGLIPAHAGKTMTAIDARAWRGAHPRSRGENPRPAPRSTASRGSSPLTRGKPALHAVAHSGGRLIPAHAGKTSGRGLRPVAPRAHPRSRGENSLTVPSRYRRRGSSPLTRGKHLETRSDQAPARLIPAHAGKTR